VAEKELDRSVDPGIAYSATLDESEGVEHVERSFGIRALGVQAPFRSGRSYSATHPTRASPRVGIRRFVARPRVRSTRTDKGCEQPRPYSTGTSETWVPHEFAHRRERRPG
jgi:hypothetical protein